MLPAGWTRVPKAKAALGALASDNCSEPSDTDRKVNKQGRVKEDFGEARSGRGPEPVTQLVSNTVQQTLTIKGGTLKFTC